MLKSVSVARRRGVKAKRVRDKNFVAATEKIFAVLEAFSQHPHSAISLEEVTQAARLAKTTAHRLLYSMQKIGYVDQHQENSNYMLSQKFFELGRDALPYQRLTSLAKPFMNALMLRFGESLHLGVLENGLVINIAVCESQHPYRIAGVVGDSNYSHSTAMGKCLLAYLSDQELDSIIRIHGLPTRASSTITNRAQLMEELEKVRRDQVATNVGENMEGVICVGAPVFNHEGRAVAALSISGPAVRMDQGMETIKKEIKRVALRLSILLGYSPDKIDAATAATVNVSNT
jgi:IclR family transcriptional regulator, KDG regulon repressor